MGFYFVLKFNSGPEHDEFNALKQKVIEAAISCWCRFLVSMILHNLATSPDDARRKEINRILFHFNNILNRDNEHGLVLIDRFSERQIDEHLRTKFSIGLTGLPSCDEMRLGQIVGFHYSAIGQSHSGSFVGVILGSFRLAVNAHSTADAQLLPTAGRLLNMLAPLFFRSPSGLVPESYLFFQPEDY